MSCCMQHFAKKFPPVRTGSFRRRCWTHRRRKAWGGNTLLKTITGPLLLARQASRPAWGWLSNHHRIASGRVAKERRSYRAASAAWARTSQSGTSPFKSVLQNCKANLFASLRETLCTELIMLGN